MRYSIQHIASLFPNAVVQLANPEESIHNVITDSRPVQQFQHSIFFALQGTQRNGHAFLSDAYDKGIRSFVVSTIPNLKLNEACNWIQVEDTLAALQQLAAYHRKQFHIPVVAITGSNGKTIVKEWFYQIACAQLAVIKSPKSYNSQLGVPLSVLQMDDSHELALFEAGISKPHEMAALKGILEPEIGIFTSLGTAHEENFGSDEKKMREKALLFHNCKNVIYPYDQEVVRGVLAEVLPPATLFGWSFISKDAPIFVEKEHASDHGLSRLTIYFPEGKKIIVNTPFKDEASIHNLISTAIGLKICGIAQEVIASGLRYIKNIPSRLELRGGKNGCLLIDDSYNNDLSGLEVALQYQSSFQIGKDKWAILTDLAQVKEKEQVYVQIARWMKAYGIVNLYAIGKDFPDYYPLSDQMQAQFFPSIDALLEKLKQSPPQDKLLLIKGSRSVGLERVVKQLADSLHPTRLEINMEHLLHNYKHYRAHTPSGTKLMVMLKASAYGTGAVEIGKLLEMEGAEYFAVAYADEGVELRKAGIQIPIMVMNTMSDQYELLSEYRLEPEIYSFSSLQSYITYCEASNLFGKIHLNIDVGMNRLGFQPEDLAELAVILKQQKKIIIQSIYAHLVASNNPSFDDFTRQQIQEFNTAFDFLVHQLGYTPLKHLANSEGINRFPEAHFSMVRLGIGLYGIGSQPQLLQVARLVSTISQIKKVKKGESVGYNRSGIVKEDGRIGVIAMGYADGLNIALGKGRGGVWIKGHFAPFIGDICMDMSMIDLSGIEDAREGEEVELFGYKKTLQSFAASLHTIPYVILTSLNKRVQRSFFFS
jgi:alanine racemase